MIPRGRRRWWAWDERGAGVARGGRDQGLVRGKRGPQPRTPLSTSPARRPLTRRVTWQSRNGGLATNSEGLPPTTIHKMKKKLL